MTDGQETMFFPGTVQDMTYVALVTPDKQQNILQC